MSIRSFALLATLTIVAYSNPTPPPAPSAPPATSTEVAAPTEGTATPGRVAVSPAPGSGATPPTPSGADALAAASSRRTATVPGTTRACQGAASRQRPRRKRPAATRASRRRGPASASSVDARTSPTRRALPSPWMRRARRLQAASWTWPRARVSRATIPRRIPRGCLGPAAAATAASRAAATTPGSIPFRARPTTTAG